VKDRPQVIGLPRLRLKGNYLAVKADAPTHPKRVGAFVAARIDSHLPWPQSLVDKPQLGWVDPITIPQRTIKITKPAGHDITA
jgi:hypothetical protein